MGRMGGRDILRRKMTGDRGRDILGRGMREMVLKGCPVTHALGAGEGGNQEPVLEWGDMDGMELMEPWRNVGKTGTDGGDEGWD